VGRGRAGGTGPRFRNRTSPNTAVFSDRASLTRLTHWANDWVVD